MKTITRRTFFNLSGLVVGAALIESCAPNITQSTPTPEETPMIPSEPTPTIRLVNLENRYIAYCGHDCKKCPLYQNGCEAGCLGETCHIACKACAVRSCAIQNKVDNCALCAQYPCNTLETQYETMDNDGYGSWARTAKAVLETIRLSS
jgi:hypothetical protein